jgi:hypothetical protein
MEPINTKFYQLGNGGSLIFERDLNALSDFLGRPHPEFHGVEVNDQPGGEVQWVICNTPFFKTCIFLQVKNLSQQFFLFNTCD